MNVKKFGKVVLSLAFISVLASCDDDIVNYPTNADSSVVTVAGDDNGDVTNNEYSDIYKNTASSGSPSASTLDNILYKMASEQYLKDDFAVSNEDFAERYQKQMLTTAKGGSYSTDNLFDEYRYALSLINSGYTIKTSSGATDLASIKAAAHAPQLINPDLKGATQDDKWHEVFTLDYNDYIDRYYKPSIYRQYLTAHYIYNQSYSSIGNTSARDVTVVKITDRTDKPGEAIKLIRAWVDEFITSDSYDLHNLARLWKGVDVSTEEQAWLDSHSISNLSSKIDEEVDKIVNNFSGPDTDWSAVTPKTSYVADGTLESSYTGSYTYPVEHGYELARRSLEVSDIITEGTFLNTASVGDVPTALKNSIFSSNISTDEASIADGSKKDVTHIINHGTADDPDYVRYITPTISASDSSDIVNKIVTYDSSSKSYFIVQLNSIVTTSRIAQNDSDSAEVKASKRKLAIDAAYEMSSTDSNKKSAIVWYLTNNTISYSDPDFYNYIKTNYPDAIDD